MFLVHCDILQNIIRIELLENKNKIFKKQTFITEGHLFLLQIQQEYNYISMNIMKKTNRVKNIIF